MAAGNVVADRYLTENDIMLECTDILTISSVDN